MIVEEVHEVEHAEVRKAEHVAERVVAHADGQQQKAGLVGVQTVAHVEAREADGREKAVLFGVRREEAASVAEVNRGTQCR